MLKVIVTGVTGFIGKNLCHKLLENNIIVYGIGRNVSVLDELSKNKLFHGIEADLSDVSKIKNIIRDRDFDCLFHLANHGVNGADKENYDIQISNIQIACDTVELANTLGCKRFVFTGSVDEYESIFVPDKEYVKPTHSRVYGVAKYAAECIGKVVAGKLGIEYVSALLALTYGEGNNTNILPNVIMRNSLDHRDINLIEGKHYFDMIYVKEAVDGLIAVANSGKNMESYYIGHEKLMTFREIVEKINSLMDEKIKLNFGCYKEDGCGVDYSQINRSKLFEDTGYKCNVPLEEGINRTYSWIKEKYNK